MAGHRRRPPNLTAGKGGRHAAKTTSRQPPERGAEAFKVPDWKPIMLDRRHFLALVVALTAHLPARALARPTTPPPTAPPLADPWRTLAAVQAHMLPGRDDGAPSAGAIGALDYLRRVLEAADTDPDDAAFLRDGTGWLNEVAKEAHGRPYADLDPAAAEATMRRIERTAAGERWLYLLLTYLLEALLADPVYAGNRDGRGWAWLGHRPGFPRPTAEKRYFQLGKPVYRRTKA